MSPSSLSFFFFNDPATTEIYTLSLHDALPISPEAPNQPADEIRNPVITSSLISSAPAAVHRSRSSRSNPSTGGTTDRKSTRLNSSHVEISYAVFCLKKKKKKKKKKNYKNKNSI